jgi:4-hydroxy-4-methyl-2-oxoglutarate aldolase
MIVDPPLLTVCRNFPRPDASILKALVGAQTGHIVDAMEGRGALDAGIKPIDGSRAAFVGTALTCETGPSDNLAIFGALAITEPGDVIVAACDSFAVTAVIGDNLAMMAKNRGVVALVTDGMVRDTPGVIAARLPVFARGVTPNSCVRSGPGRIGQPIVCAGVAIDSGDVDGVVAVPRLRLDSIISRLAEVLAAEKELQARIAEGLGVLDQVVALMSSDRVRYLD